MLKSRCKKTVQTGAERPCKELQEEEAKEAVSSIVCKSLHKKSGSLQNVAKSRLIAPRRIELSPIEGCKDGFPEPCIHNGTHKHELSKDLQELIELWPKLSDRAKQSIYDIVINDITTNSKR